MEDEFRRLLRDISQSFLDGNLALWRSRLILPFSLITKSEHMILKTETDVADNFALYLKARDALAVELVDRSPITLEETADGTWFGGFETRLMRNEALIAPPYTSTAIMRIVEERFRMSSFVDARGHCEWTECADTD